MTVEDNLRDDINKQIIMKIQIGKYDTIYQDCEQCLQK
jgi:hypothetical protein